MTGDLTRLARKEQLVTTHLGRANLTERHFRIVFGALLLLGLYFDWHSLIWSIVGALIFQGVTNWRIARIVSRLRHGPAVALPACCGHTPDTLPSRINFEAERALCLIVAVALIAFYDPRHAQTWIIPWVIGFALFGAGLSGVCPMILGLKRLGFR